MDHGLWKQLEQMSLGQAVVCSARCMGEHLITMVLLVLVTMVILVLVDMVMLVLVTIVILNLVTIVVMLIPAIPPGRTKHQCCFRHGRTATGTRAKNHQTFRPM